MLEITEVEENKEMKTIDYSLRDLWDNIKCTNIQVIRVQERREKERAWEGIDIRVKSFPAMGKEIATQVQESQRVPNRINPRRNMVTCINQANKNLN